MAALADPYATKSADPYATAPDVDALITKYASKYGVPEPLARKIANIETGGSKDRRTATSSVGARGIFQLMPDTFAEMGVGTDITDPEQNVHAGVKYLSRQLKAFGGDWKLAAAAYNGGPGAVSYYRKRGTFKGYGSPGNPNETQNYVDMVASILPGNFAKGLTQPIVQQAKAAENPPDPYAPVSTQRPTDPFATQQAPEYVDPAAHGAKLSPANAQAIKRSASTLGDIVQRTGHATQAEIAGRSPLDLLLGRGEGDFMQTLVHGNTPEQQSRNAETIYHDWGITDPVGKFATDVVTDVGSFLGVGLPGKVMKGRSLAGAALEGVERHTLPVAMKAGDAAAAGVRNVAQKFAKPGEINQYTGERAEQAIHPGVDAALGVAGAAGRVTHDVLGVDAKAKRALARTFGPAWLDHYSDAYAVRSHASSLKSDLAGRYHNELNEIVRGTDEAQQHAIFDAVDRGTIEQLPPDLQQRAVRLRNMTDAQAFTRGDEGVRAKTIGRMGNLPEYAKAHVSAKPRNLQSMEQFRERYIPAGSPNEDLFARGEAGLSAALGEAPTTSLLEHQNPSLKERSTPLGYHGAPTKTLAQLRKNIDAFAKDVAKHEAEQRIAQMPAKAQGVARDMFEVQLANDSSDWERATKGLKTVQDIDKTALFYLPFRHMGNIGSLGMVAEPLGTLKGALNYAKNIRSTGEDKWARMNDAIKAGVVQLGPSDKSSAFADLIGKGAQKLGSVPFVGKALAAPLHGAKAVYDFSGKQLWAFEDEVAHAIWREKVNAGMNPNRAAQETRAEIVDYSNRGPLAKAAAPFAPFPTWRTKAPLAVARNVIKNPGRAGALARTAPAAFGGSQPGPFGEDVTSSLPFAEANQLGSAPFKYGRGTMGVPMRLLANEVLNEFSRSALAKDSKAQHELHDWFTYGKEPSAYVVSQLPGLGQALQLTGHGLFDDGSKGFAQNLVESQTGLHKALPERSPGKRERLTSRFYEQNPHGTPRELYRYLRRHGVR